MGRFLNALLATAAATGLTIMLAQPAIAADPAAGAKVFKAQCALCHAATAGAAPGVGPSLGGVVGRTSGTQAAFHPRYSAAMKSAARTWTAANLKLYIANPAKTIPGNQMPFAGLKDPAQVDNVVAYLATLH
jgi:cytochrome c